VVKSLNSDYLYKGHCQDLELRVKQHNLGMTKSLRPYLPVALAYQEEFPTLKEAVAREKYFKSAAGRKFLKSALAPYFNARPTEH
jgi:putative endonuclease